MTDWKAVGYGFVAMLLAEVLAAIVPVLGHGLAGLVGGFVAGYLAGGGLRKVKEKAPPFRAEMNPTDDDTNHDDRTAGYSTPRNPYLQVNLTT